MRTARLLTGPVLAVAATALAATPAHAAADDLEVFPSTAAPGSTVTVDTTACPDSGAATGDASAVGAGTFALAPRAHAGETVGQFVGQFKVPPSAQPGTYQIVVECSGGTRASGDLTVTLSAAREQVQPKGHVDTGVGGALGPDPVQTAAGVAALAVAAAGGTWLLHRRARGDGI